jgi:hypothetical protein
MRPWQYPPCFDFQYGDWMRRDFEAGNVEPWATTVYPDLALLLTQVMIASTALVGPPVSALLDPAPYRDFMTATVSKLDRLGCFDCEDVVSAPQDGASIIGSSHRAGFVRGVRVPRSIPGVLATSRIRCITTTRFDC